MKYSVFYLLSIIFLLSASSSILAHPHLDEESFKLFHPDKEYNEGPKHEHNNGKQPKGKGLKGKKGIKPKKVYKKYLTGANLLEVSEDVKIFNKLKTIDFKVKNRSSKPISIIFGKVYRVEEKGSKLLKSIVVNNPNSSGTLVGGSSHKPNTEAVWRFYIYPRWLSKDEKYKYILNINSRSIYY